MDEETLANIALVLARDRVRQEPIQFNVGTVRNIGNLAKRTGIPIETLKLFFRTLIGEAVEELLGDYPQRNRTQTKEGKVGS